MMLSAIHQSRRGFIRSLLICGGFAPLLISLVREAGANSALPIIPGVQEYSGDFRINGNSVTVGQMVSPGDVVTTGADGSGIIIIGQHAYMIRENAEIEFYTDDFTQDEDGNISGVIKIISGAVLSVFGKTNTTINTPFASIGIRGTGCYIDSSADKTYACVCYGRGELSGIDGKHLETVVTTHHDSPRLIYPPGSGVLIEKAKVIDHTNAELRLLESLVNRKPLFDLLGNNHRDEY